MANPSAYIVGLLVETFGSWWNIFAIWGNFWVILQDSQLLSVSVNS
jgi:hypothetical protein